ncbi:hypothetical protein LTR24_005254 [Lithohypha guttulata]|uniref:Uncharacterized protein n=1 Tax=Lithohypha guttulata TaxID=1690604 RepID=A0ABR0K9S9_9EURO|nr:hypothetical protein LTR24_005254 [Lithohypha guttulata]
MKSQRSLQSQMSKLKRSDMPSDFGLLPDTILKPESEALPSLFSKDFRKRLRIEWKAFVQTPMDIVRFFYLTWWLAKKDHVTGKRPPSPLLLRDRYRIARDLHRRLYTAIAAGDRETIEQIACMGLKRELQIKLDHRKALQSPPETWTIQYKGLLPTSERTPWLMQAFLPPWLKSTQIMADRYAQLPVGEDASLRQIFVRIRSKQTLDRNDGKGVKEVERSEIVVIQKMKMSGEEDDWMIWGTTEPTTGKKLDEVLNASDRSGRETFASRLQNTMMGVAQKQGSNPGM